MTATQIREAVAAEVRAALARDGRKAARLAEEAGISPAALSRKLRGLTPFYVEELLNIADALNIDPAPLFVPRETQAGRDERAAEPAAA
ncbi:MAG: helix-turn-helix transcriptional regulator [Propionicimonas sp.]